MVDRIEILMMMNTKLGSGSMGGSDARKGRPARDSEHQLIQSGKHQAQTVLKLDMGDSDQR
jgi:hypothetical protein